MKLKKLRLTKEKDDEQQKNDLPSLKKNLPTIKEQHQKLLNQWKAEKAPLEKMNKLKEEIEQQHMHFKQQNANGDYAKASEIKYGKLAKLEKQLDTEQEKLKKLKTTSD